MGWRVINGRTAARLRVAAFGALAAVTAVVGGLAAVTASWPLRPIPLAPDLVRVRQARAEAALAGPTPDLERAAAESRAALALAPMSPHAWLRLAYVESQPVLTPQALADIERSYAVAPFGPSVTRWRLGFLYERWGELTPGLRAQANDEMRAYALRNAGAARRLATGVRHPAGRVAAVMTWHMSQSEA